MKNDIHIPKYFFLRYKYNTYVKLISSIFFVCDRLNIFFRVSKIFSKKRIF